MQFSYSSTNSFQFGFWGTEFRLKNFVYLELGLWWLCSVLLSDLFLMLQIQVTVRIFIPMVLLSLALHLFLCLTFDL